MINKTGKHCVCGELHAGFFWNEVCKQQEISSGPLYTLGVLSSGSTENKCSSQTTQELSCPT